MGSFNQDIADMQFDAALTCMSLQWAVHKGESAGKGASMPMQSLQLLRVATRVQHIWMDAYLVSKSEKTAMLYRMSSGKLSMQAARRGSALLAAAAAFLFLLRDHHRSD